MRYWILALFLLAGSLAVVFLLGGDTVPPARSEVLAAHSPAPPSGGGEAAPLDAPLPSALVGQVVASGSGRGIEGARLRLYPRSSGADGAPGAPLECTSDGEGGFRFDVRGVEGDLVVEARGFAQRAWADVRGGETLVLPLTAAAGLEGSVRMAGGEPAPLGSAVLLWESRGGEAKGALLARAETGAEGNFLFEGLAQGAYALYTLPRGSGGCLRPVVLLHRGEQVKVECVASRGIPWRGRVTLRGGGAPPPGTLVRWRPWMRGLPVDSCAELERVARTDGAGRFLFEALAPGRARVTVETPYGARIERELSLPARGEREERLVLPAAAELSGLLRLPSGGACGGGWLAVAPARGAQDLPWASLASLSSPARPGLTVLRADPQGRFESGPLPSGIDLWLAAYPQTVSAVESAPVQRWVRLEPGERRELELRLCEVVFVRGRVIDPSGQGIADAEVTVDVDGGRVPHGEEERLADLALPETFRAHSRWLSMHTDSEGTFAFPRLPATRVRLRASLPGWVGGVRWLDLRGGIVPRSVDLRLERGVGLHGQVRESAGAAVEGAELRLVGADGEAVATTRSDAFGRYRFAAQLRGEYELTLERTGFVPQRRSIALGGEGDQRVDLTLTAREEPLPGRLHGELVQAGSGEPLEGIVLKGAEGWLQTEGSAFSLEGVAAGRVNLFASAPGFETYRFAPRELAPGEDLDLGRIALRPVVTVRVRLRDAGGKPLAGAEVRLERLGEAPVPGPLIPKSVVLEFDGRTRLYGAEGVGLHPWRLWIKAPGRPILKRRVEVEDGECIEVRLPPASSRRRRPSRGG